MSFMSNPGVGAIYPYRTAFVADIGEAESANTTVTRVLEAAALGLVDSVVINGDISYATGCESKGCTTWDSYCRMASPLAATVPWMVTIGNHEEGDSANFIYAISSTYRFAGMPTGGRNDAGTGLRYYSWEAGPVHYISIDSFYVLYGPLQPLTKWVTEDLAAIDYEKTPWVVVSLHAPWCALPRCVKLADCSPSRLTPLRPRPVPPPRRQLQQGPPARGRARAPRPRGDVRRRGRERHLLGARARLVSRGARNAVHAR
jgi:hypothetical protein